MENALQCSGQENAGAINSARATPHRLCHPFRFTQHPLSRPGDRPTFRVARLRAVIGSAFVALMGITQPVDGGTVLTFDGLSSGTGGIVISNGYGGLIWSNFSCINGSLQPPTTGYHNGAISTPNVAVNGYGDPAVLRYTGPFDLNSAYLTAGYVNGLQVRVQGFAGGNLVYDNTYSLSTTNPSFITFSYFQVDTVRFAATPSSWFALDNLDITRSNAPPPAANFEARPSSGYAPLGVQFVDQSTGSLFAWDWDFGDGYPHDSSQNPFHCFNDVGTFTVTLTVMGSDGPSSTKRATITVGPIGPTMVRGCGCLPNGNISNIVAIAAGSHSLLLKSDQTVVALGRYSDGTPVVVPPGLSNVIAIAAGNGTSFALKSDGTVFYWNQSGPIALPPSVTNIVAISSGLALRADGTVLGLGGRYVPPGLSNVVAVSAGGMGLALKDDGTVVGLYVNYGHADPSTLSNIVAISAADNCCYEAWEALRADGVVLAGSPYTNRWYSTGVGDIVAISASRGNSDLYHLSWALRADGTVAVIHPAVSYCRDP